MQTQRVALADLRPHPANYNEHSPEQLEEIKASLARFDQYRPVVVWQGTILAGHGVTEAAKLAGWEEIEVCDVSHLDETEALALLAADNETARLGKPDLEKLVGLAKLVQQRGSSVPGITVEGLKRLTKKTDATKAKEAGKPKPEKITFSLDAEQMETLTRALATAKEKHPLIANEDTPKANAAALAFVCEIFLGADL